MIVTEEQHKKEIDICEKCTNSGPDLQPGRCNRCSIGLRLKAYYDKKDTNEYYWYEDDEKFKFDYGEWRLKQ